MTAPDRDPIATAVSAFDAATVARAQQPPKPSFVAMLHAAFEAARADRTSKPTDRGVR